MAKKKPHIHQEHLDRIAHQKNERRIKTARELLRDGVVNSIYALEWKERPVDILTYISDPEYLGGITESGKAIFPGWKKALVEMFSNQQKYIIVLTGAMGVGKTYIACVGISYIIYLIHCLKDPFSFLGKASSGKLAVSFFNLNKSMSDTLGYQKLQHILYHSPWFIKNALRVKEGKTNEVQMPLVDCLLSSPNSQGYGITGGDTITGILDEVDSPNAGLTQKKKVLATYEQTIGRFKNRFVSTTGSLGKFFIVSSKQETMGFIDTFIAERKNDPSVLVFDLAKWEANPDINHSGKKFLVALPGDAFHEPKILQDGEATEPYLLQGYELLQVPIELKYDFELNLVQEIRNTAGRSISGMRSDKLFKSETFVKECFDSTRLDPVKTHTIDIGLKDDLELIWYFNLKNIRTPYEVPRYIHMDFGLSGDALGLSMCGICGFVEKDIQQQDGSFQKQRLPIIETDFAIRLKAKENDEIPLHKVSKLILDLKAAGINIRLFTADLLMASAYSFQVLEKSGIKTEYLSVDKTDGPYTAWRDLVYEKRWRCFSHSYLLFEAKYLEHNKKTKKVDHPIKIAETEVLVNGDIKDFVVEGTKDLTDAVSGSVSMCLKDAVNIPDLSHVVGVMNNIISAITSNEDEDMTQHLFKIPGGHKVIDVSENPVDKSIQRMLDILKNQ